MGLMESLKNQMDSNRKIELKNPMELEELYAFILENMDASIFGKPELKKGIMGKAIVYPKISRVTPRITIKGNVVTINKVTDTSSTTMSVGGVGFKLDKDMQGKNALNTMDSGAAYFISTADALEAALMGK